MSQEFTRIQTTREATSDILQLLQNNEIGQEGKGMVYQHVNVKPKTDHISGSVEYLKVSVGGKVIGMCANVKRKLVNDNFACNYIRYFTFLKGFRVTNINNRRKRPSLLKQEVKDYLGKSNDGITYAYVDLTNDRSRAICQEFGFREVGQFATLIFSRFFRKRSNRIQKVGFNEVKNLLLKEYREYSLFTTDNLQYQHSGYYVIKDGTEIVAGMAVTEERWKIKAMPDLLGKLLMRAKLPVISRLFSSDYQFLVAEGIYVKNGCSEALTELMEGVLHLTGQHVIMMWADPDSPLYRTIKSLPLGLLSKLKPEVKASVIARNAGHQLKNIYISGFDLT